MTAKTKYELRIYADAYILFEGSMGPGKLLFYKLPKVRVGSLREVVMNIMIETGIDLRKFKLRYSHIYDVRKPNRIKCLDIKFFER